MRNGMIAAIAGMITVAACASPQEALPDGPPVVGEVAAETGIAVETWVDGLEHPWGLVFLPDGRALVTERPGRLRVIGVNGKLQPAPVAGVPPVLAQGQGGLLDVTIDPGFDSNGLVYLSFAKGTPDANGLAVARGRLAGDRLEDVTLVLDNPVKKSGGQHFGSRFAWLPDETLLVTVADGGNPPLRIGGELARMQGQNNRTINGATIRITRDGEAPADNPDFGGGEPRLWTMGHRNQQGLAIDPETGVIWSSEHGSRGGDELNRLERGKNYGWPKVSYTQEYTSDAFVTPYRTLEGHADPASVWTPSIAASGLAVYRGTAFPQWNGNILAGGLKSGDVRRIVLDDEGRPAGETSISIGQRVRDVRVGPDGLIYILTDEAEGRILRIRPDHD